MLWNEYLGKVELWNNNILICNITDIVKLNGILPTLEKNYIVVVTLEDNMRLTQQVTWEISVHIEKNTNVFNIKISEIKAFFTSNLDGRKQYGYTNHDGYIKKLNNKIYNTINEVYNTLNELCELFEKSISEEHLKNIKLNEKHINLAEIKMDEYHFLIQSKNLNLEHSKIKLKTTNKKELIYKRTFHKPNSSLEYFSLCFNNNSKKYFIEYNKTNFLIKNKIKYCDDIKDVDTSYIGVFSHEYKNITK